MITDEQLEAGLELVENNEAFIMRHPVFGKVKLTRDGEWIQVDLGDSGTSFWCQYVSLDLGAVAFWVETNIIGMINAKDLKVFQLKHIMVFDLDGKVDCVRRFTTVDEFEESMAGYLSCGYRKVDEDDTRVVVQRVEVLE